MLSEHGPIIGLDVNSLRLELQLEVGWQNVTA